MKTDVICPYCCHKFHPNEAEFRLNESVVSKGGKGKKQPAAGKKLDEKLYNYYRIILQNPEAEAKKEATQFSSITLDTPGVSLDDTLIERHGFAPRIKYKDPQNKIHDLEIRLCPNCHNNLPTGYGLRDTVLISILGDARSGKSVFLTMLIDELESNVDMASKLTFIGDTHVRETFNTNYQKPLLREHTLIRSTKRQKIPPFAFNFWYEYKAEDGTLKENTIDVIFYDIAGEDLRDDNAIRTNGFNIRDSSGIIFLADPTNFTNLIDLFRFSDHALIEAIPKENSTRDIFSTLYNFFIGFQTERSAIPFALVLSKADLFSLTHFEFFNNKPENRIQNLLNGEEHRGALNMRCIKGLNFEVRELLSALNEDVIVNNAVGCFQSVNCFAMSSLGKKPSVEQISDPNTNDTVAKGFIDGPPQPFRVKEAFYWILMKNDLLLKYENDRYTRIGNSTPTRSVVSSIPSIWGWLRRLFRRGKGEEKKTR